MFILPQNVFSQTKDELAKMRNDFDQYKQEEQGKFKKYVEAQDKAFAEYLKNDWEQFELFKSDKVSRIPGPERIPHFKPDMHISANVEIPRLEKRDDDVLTAISIPLPEVKPIKVKLPVLVELEPILNLKTAKLDFYGEDLKFFYDKDIHQNPGTTNGPNMIAAYFTELSESNYFSLLENLLRTQRKLNLNDWGYLKLVENLSNQICVTEKEEILFQWFFLLKSGYKVKIAYYNDDISLMIPAQNTIFGLPYYTFNEDRYYILDKEFQQIHTYNKDYPGAERLFDLHINQVPNLPLDIQYRSFSLKNGDEMKIAYNNNLINYYNDFPQTELSIFFQAAMTPITRESIDSYFEPLLKDKSQKEAVAFILDFVQYQFDYKTDQEQFGYEKFFFPDEVFMYPYADCEDRSVLFSYLVKELTGLDVVGLDYPGHIATAVKFDNSVDGRYVIYQGEKYTICDPTFIGAPVGACMPQFENTKAGIIPLPDVYSVEEIVEPIWAKIYESGGYRNNVEQAAIVDNNGNYIVCGSYNKKMNLLGENLLSNNQRCGFVASFSPEEKLLWILSLDSAEYVSPEYLSLNDNEGIIISGKTTDGKEQKQFVLSLNNSQQTEWYCDFIPKENDERISSQMNFYVNSKGELIESESVNDLSVDDGGAISILPDGLIRLNAYIPAPAYLAVNRKFSSIEMAKLWKKRSDQYQQNSCHNSVSGLFAFFNTVEEFNLEVSGKEIIASLNAFIPNFGMGNACANENLKKIEKISIDHGVMTINIINGSSIILGSLLIHDNAKLSLKNYQTGNLKITVIDGVEFKSIIRKFDVNYIKVFRVNGDVMIDYNKKHEQRILSAKPDFIN
jgi:hypothetical protein